MKRGEGERKGETRFVFAFSFFSKNNDKKKNNRTVDLKQGFLAYLTNAHTVALDEIVDFHQTLYTLLCVLGFQTLQVREEKNKNKSQKENREEKKKVIVK